MTGVMAGINMSGDLKLPAKNIPTGTLTAIGASLAIYSIYVLILGATVSREALLTNYMIAQVRGEYIKIMRVVIKEWQVTYKLKLKETN